MRPVTQCIEIPRPKSYSGLRMTTKKKHERPKDYLPLQRLKINAAFVPPNPNEFDSA